MNTSSFTYMVPIGIGSAAAVRVGQGLGRRDPRAASRAGWTALAMGSSFMTCTAISFWLIPQYIVRIYSPDPAVMQSASKLLYVAAFFQLFDGLQAIATGALRGAGDTRAPMIFSVLFYWLVGLPVGYYLCFRIGWGAEGIWIGLCAALILIGSALLLLWRRGERTFSDRIIALSQVQVGNSA